MPVSRFREQHDPKSGFNAHNEFFIDKFDGFVKSSLRWIFEFLQYFQLLRIESVVKTVWEVEMPSRLAPREETAPWGILTSLDLYTCNPETIRDAEKIRQYVIELCKLIDMKRFGECRVVHFGADERVEGYSMIQLIETSLISGHFANLTNAAYIDVFSCKPYNSDAMALFSKEFFEAKSMNMHLRERM